MPADLLESVEVNKTLQANMDADGIGGSVNLVTKTASVRPTISIMGAGGYNPILGGRNLVQTTGTVGMRFGGEQKVRRFVRTFRIGTAAALMTSAHSSILRNLNTPRSRIGTTNSN